MPGRRRRAPRPGAAQGPRGRVSAARLMAGTYMRSAPARAAVPPARRPARRRAAAAAPAGRARAGRQPAAGPWQRPAPGREKFAERRPARHEHEPRRLLGPQRRAAAPVHVGAVAAMPRGSRSRPARRRCRRAGTAHVRPRTRARGDRAARRLARRRRVRDRRDAGGAAAAARGGRGADERYRARGEAHPVNLPERGFSG